MLNDIEIDKNFEPKDPVKRPTNDVTRIFELWKQFELLKLAFVLSDVWNKPEHLGLPSVTKPSLRTFSS